MQLIQIEQLVQCIYHFSIFAYHLQDLIDLVATIAITTVQG